MNLYRLLPILALLAVAACGTNPLPTTNPPTALPATSAILAPTPSAVNPAPATAFVPSPTPIASSGYPAPGPSAVPQSATAEPSPTALPSPTLPAFLPTVTPPPFTPLPPAPIIGLHVVRPGETIFCIARGYGVLPAAIVQANGLSSPSFLIATNQPLLIPAVQWVDIAPGPVCQPQFVSPFPGLPVSTSTPMVGAAPAAPPLVVIIDFRCIANCGSKDGAYQLHMDVRAGGSVPPYTYDPAQSFDVSNLPHCQSAQGSVTVASADGQIAKQTWTYIDTACP